MANICVYTVLLNGFKRRLTLMILNYNFYFNESLGGADLKSKCQTYTTCKIYILLFYI